MNYRNKAITESPKKRIAKTIVAIKRTLSAPLLVIFTLPAPLPPKAPDKPLSRFWNRMESINRRAKIICATFIQNIEKILLGTL